MGVRLQKKVKNARSNWEHKIGRRVPAACSVSAAKRPWRFPPPSRPVIFLHTTPDQPAKPLGQSNCFSALQNAFHTSVPSTYSAAVMWNTEAKEPVRSTMKPAAAPGKGQSGGGEGGQ